MHGISSLKALETCRAMINILLQVKEELKVAFMPQQMTAPETQAPLPAWQETVQQLSGTPIPKRAAFSRAEQIQGALCQISKRYNNHLKTDSMGAQTSTKALTLRAAGEQQHKPLQTVGAAAPEQSTEAGVGSRRGGNGQRSKDAGKGVFQRSRKKPRMSTGPAQGSVQDAAFFMGLQQGSPSPSSETSDCSDDSLAAG